MISSRREFLGGAGSGIAWQHAMGAARGKIKGIAFDAFPILDPRPVFALAEEIFPGKGAELSNIWRTRQFEYCWLRTLSRSYVDFRQVTGDALRFAGKAGKVEISAEQHARLLGAYLKLRCWPEVPAALRKLKDAGIRLAFLSNMTEEMLQSGIQNSGLEGVFEHVLSTDRVKAFKPDPRAYQMGREAFGLQPGEILFAAFAGWDAAGAKAFGYPTYWVNRGNQAAEELGAAADGMGGTLDDLVKFL